MKSYLSLIILFSSLLVPITNLGQCIPVLSQNPISSATAQSQDVNEADQLALQIVELYKQGKYDTALPLAQRLLALRETALGANHLLTAQALTNLAELFLAKEKKKEAKNYYQKAIAIYEKNPGAEKTEFAAILERYACLLAELGAATETLVVEKQLYKLYNGLDPHEAGLHAIKLPFPPFPQEAKSKRLTGGVVARVTIDETGKVTKVEILCGHPVLARAAGAAAWRALFKPALDAGRPVKVVGIVTYRLTTEGP